MKRLISGVLAVLLAASGSRALALDLQDDGPAPTARELVSEAVAVLRSRRSTEQDVNAASAALLELGAAGARALAQHATRELKSLRKSNERAEAKLVKAFDKRASSIIDRRLDRKALAEVDELRGLIRRIASGPDLTKERIKAESDPAFERLKILLTIQPGEVWEADEELFEDWVALADSVASESRWLARWGKAKAALEADPEGERSAKRLKAPEVPALDAEGLAGQFRWRAWLATPMGENDRRVLEENEALAREVDPKEADGIRALNQRRVLIGLNAQSIDVKLCEAGRGHSKDMKDNDFFSHTSPLPGKKSFTDRASLAGASANAENIAIGASTGEAVIMQWWYSPGHHKNMLGGQSRTGLGRFETHWTQLFG